MYMNIWQWLTFGVGFLIFGYYSYFIIPKNAGLLGLSFIPFFILAGMIFGLLGILFIISALLQNIKKIKIV